METLTQIWERLPDKSDKGSTHSYLSAYEKILSEYRHTLIPVLEIGIFNGASMKLWEEYFYNAGIYGVDCDEQPHGGMADLRPMIAESKWNIFILDAENEAQVKKHFEGKKFDVIIEDAGHHVDQQLKIYNVFKNYLTEEGVYIIEDVQDIDSTRELFEKIDSEKEITILDRRHIKERYDDVLIIIKNKQ